MIFIRPMKKVFGATLSATVCATVAACVLTTVAAPMTARAELDNASKDALEKTQALLRDARQREAAMKGNQGATQNHQELTGFAGGSANVDAVYNMSADIFGDIVKQSNGDPAKMQELLQNAQKNPEAFLKSLSSGQQQSIKALAEKIEKEQRGPSGKP